MRDLAVGVGPDLGPGGLVVAGRAHRVGVLVGLPRAVDLLDQPVGDAVVAVRMVGRHGRRAHHHVGAVRAQHVLLVLADLVRADEDAFVAALLGHQRQPDAGVAGGRFDDGAAGLELAAGLGGVDHLDRDAVLGAAAGVEVLDLGRNRAGAFGDNGVQLHQRGIADELTDVPGDAHDVHRLRPADRATRWPLGCSRRSACSDRVASGTMGAASWKTCIWPGQTRTSTGTPAAASMWAALRASLTSTSEPDT